MFYSKTGWDIGPRQNELADCLINHARYNQSLLDKYIKPEAQYITLVRDAELRTSSVVRFFPKQFEKMVS